MFGRKAAAPVTAHASTMPARDTDEIDERFPGVGGLFKLVGVFRDKCRASLTRQVSTC